MATGKKNFWLKLRKDFLFGDEVGYLMSLPNMGKFVVLYWQLCALSINTGGELVAKVGKIKVPYTYERIQQECKYHSLAEVVEGLTVLADLGLITKQRNGVYKVNDFAKLVGSETDYAEQKRRQREKRSSEQPDSDMDVPMDVPVDAGADTSADEGVDNVHTDIRYKILDIRSLDNKDLDISLYGDDGQRAGAKRIEQYLQRRGLDPKQFFGTTDEVMATVKQITLNIFARFANRPATDLDVTSVYNEICENYMIPGTDDWAVKIFPDRTELLMYAFEQATKSGNPGNWNYIYGVLRKLAQRGITTLDQAEDYDENL